jgi:hypothetical protein
MPCRAVDSTEITFLGDGALSWFAGKPLPGNKWQARKHGVQGRRQWRKVHLAMDTATSDIRAVEFTPSRDGDSPLLPDLRGQIPEDEQIGTVTAPSRDIASRCPAGQWTAPTIHVAATPPSSRAAPLRSSRSERTGGRAWKEDCQAARARIRIEAKPLIVCSQTTAGQWMHCVKLLGQRLSARGPDRQTAEIHIRIALMNRFNALGTAEIIRTA